MYSAYRMCVCVIVWNFMGRPLVNVGVAVYRRIKSQPILGPSCILKKIDASLKE
jgi:hypothetical protein